MRSNPFTGRGLAAAAILAGIVAAPALLAQGSQAQQTSQAKQGTETKQTDTSKQAPPKPASQPSQTTAGRVTETFTATTANMVRGAKENLKIDLIRWSTDADRDQLFAALKDKGSDKLADALQALTTVGYVWTGSGNLGYSIHYAQRLPLAAGGERIILATDRKLGSWDRDGWKVSDQASSVDYPFTVIELHVNQKGEGEGKMSLSTKVTADPEHKTIALENYAAAPVLLQGVKRVRGSERSTS